jgi:hypothetical protein
MPCNYSVQVIVENWFCYNVTAENIDVVKTTIRFVNIFYNLFQVGKLCTKDDSQIMLKSFRYGSIYFIKVFI